MLVIIGSNGQLGWELVRQSRIQGLEARGLDCPGIDIAMDDSTRSCLEPLPGTIVVNAAAHTAVDLAEFEPERAFAVNHTGVRNLALHCRERQIPMIHVSTDYVFDGSKKGAYLEEDPVSPVGVYGRSKEAGERELRGILKNHVILRTAWLYGTHGRNFVKTMMRQAREREVLRVVADQWGCPTYAADLAHAVLQIAGRYLEGKAIPWGTYHYCGTGATTWHGFAEAIIAFAREHENLKVKEIVPLTTAEYPTPARRPANSVLDCSKIERCFGIRPRPWKESLAEMMRSLISSFSVSHT